MDTLRFLFLSSIFFLSGCEKKFDYEKEELEPDVESYYTIKNRRILIIKSTRDFEIKQIFINKTNEKEELEATCISTCLMNKDLIIENNMPGFTIKGAMIREIKDDEEFNVRIAIDVGAKHVVGSTAKKK
ncbi:hypothetical protein [Janthinobacterium sp. B9-8]|uniref:hypothetical protein n=1 Tax=Janthinobacterium sp. B9-8 TaxID=1236179 RepID=UPI00061D0939|nr:hypothetical protein [Janthinobacterium sp. B9-8]AMC33918.1 hypothetical protein VN23_04535 [Janthinobacterium sp. B9-8]